MSNPSELHYTKDHEWVRIEGDIAYVGITDHAQDALGDVVFVDVPHEDAEFSRGDEACNIESVKAAAPVYAPLSGTVAQVNAELDQTPELLNQKPYETFIFSIRIADKNEVGKLLSVTEYETLLAEEKES